MAGESPIHGPRIFLALFVLSSLTAVSGLGCALFYTRPVQEMSDTAAALRAAREIQADTLSPELYRQANEMMYRAKREYRYKNFKLAEEFASKARTFAEQSEFEAMRKGGVRSETITDPQEAAAVAGANPTPSYTPYAYPSPVSTPAEDYEKRKAEDDQAEKQSVQKRAPSSNSLLIR